MGFVRKTPAGRHRACWRDPAGHQRSKTFKTKREANAFLAEVESALNRGTYVAPGAGRLRFAEYATQWLAARNDEKATVARDASIMRNHVLPRWGAVPLSKIEHLAVQEWVTSLGGEAVGGDGRGMLPAHLGRAALGRATGWSASIRARECG